MKVLNYTALKKREKTVYSIAGFTIPAGGIPLRLLISVGVCELIFNIIGIALSLHFGWKYVDFKTGDSTVGLCFVVPPLFIGFAIYKFKIKGYPIVSYLAQVAKLQFSPKYTDIDGNKCNDVTSNLNLYTLDDLL